MRRKRYFVAWAAISLCLASSLSAQNISVQHLWGKSIGKAQTLTIENGLYDLALSAKSVREKFYAEALAFLNREK
ncbi:MAG: hypothetical protein K2I66_06080 [Bacteroidales bacterium]|nr:hypothetical protein [Bacteroidales bacterium]